MKEVKITVIFVFLIPLFLSFGIRYIPDSRQPDLGESVKISDGGKKIEFEVKLDRSGLTGIAVSVKNPQRSKEDLRFTIYDEGGNVLRESVVNGLSIPDGALTKFIFSPISKDGILKGVFQSNTGEENAMGIYLEKGTERPAFISLYKPTSRLALVSHIYEGWVRKFFSDPVFAVLYLLIISGLLGSIVFVAGTRN